MDKAGHVFRWLLILALLASAVILLLRTEYFSPSLRELAQEPQPWNTPDPGETEALDTLYPISVLVSFPDGQRLALSRDGQTVRPAFFSYSALLGEALGSSDPPQAITEGSYQSGIENGCIYLDLGFSCPLRLLSDWLGAGPGGLGNGDAAERLYLGLEGDGVSLSFRDREGNCFRCTSAVQPETLLARMAEFQGEEASFAYENSALTGVDPYLILTGGAPEKREAELSVGRDAADLDTLAEAMGINSRMASSYFDADNTLVLKEDERTLRLDREGWATYRLSPGSADPERLGLTAAVRMAAKLASGAAKSMGGDALVRFAGAETGESETYTVRFDYCLSGLPVLQESDHAVTVTVRNGVILQARVALRSYRLTDRPETAVLPPLLAAAAAAGRGGGAPELAYYDAAGAVRCGWIDKRGTL
ncbi:MAG: hypothetical protein IJU29_02275 [Oscillospiraceae bacterium]|nr:hypothetical protein [Oscillospiraceae bacterium]